MTTSAQHTTDWVASARREGGVIPREAALQACSGRTYAGIPYYVTHAHGDGITIRLVPMHGECRDVNLTYEQAQDAGIEVAAETERIEQGSDPFHRSMFRGAVSSLRTAESMLNYLSNEADGHAKAEAENIRAGVHGALLAAGCKPTFDPRN